jgi:hypothetical protein
MHGSRAAARVCCWHRETHQETIESSRTRNTVTIEIASALDMLLKCKMQCQPPKVQITDALLRERSVTLLKDLRIQVS